MLFQKRYYPRFIVPTQKCFYPRCIVPNRPVPDMMFQLNKLKRECPRCGVPKTKTKTLSQMWCSKLKLKRQCPRCDVPKQKLNTVPDVMFHAWVLFVQNVLYYTGDWDGCACTIWRGTGYTGGYPPYPSYTVAEHETFSSYPYARAKRRSPNW